MTRSWGRFVALGVLGVACSAHHVKVDADDGKGGTAGSGGTATTSPDSGGAIATMSGAANVGKAGGAGGTGAQVGDGGDTAKGGDGGAAGHPTHERNLECESPKALSGGYVECKNGFLHRTEPGVCPSHVVKTSQGGQTARGDDDCAQDSDCGGDPLTFCGNDENWLCAEPDDTVRCMAGCERDSDCKKGEICLCGDAQLTGEAPLGQCVKASCTRDSDCAPGYLCVSSPEFLWQASFSCQSPDDECGGNEDCQNLGFGGASFGVPVPWDGAACSRVGAKRVCNAPGCGS